MNYREHVIMFKSRNKDNAGITDFHERTEMHWWSEENMEEKFADFVRRGVKGETSRYYISVNPRNLDRAKRLLIIKILQNDDFDIKKIENEIFSCAMDPSCALTKQWLLDFDSRNTGKFAFFRDYLNKIGDLYPQWFPTPNGFHVIIDHGFDTREMKELFPEVEIHRDNYCLFCVKTNE